MCFDATVKVGVGEKKSKFAVINVSNMRLPSLKKYKIF